MGKAILDRRIRIMEAEGIVFTTNANVGVSPDAAALRDEFDAVVLACGVPVGRDLPIPGRALEGIHFAMDYLPLQNKRCEGDAVPDSRFITAKDKHVVIIGGGDTRPHRAV